LRDAGPDDAGNGAAKTRHNRQGFSLTIEKYEKSLVFISWAYSRRGAMMLTRADGFERPASQS
jgi:hypothetical protein